MSVHWKPLHFEPFHLQASGPAAVLLIHGFGSVPGEMRELGNQLWAAGYSALAVHLPGHQPPHFPDLHRYSRLDWLTCAEEALHILVREKRVVIVCGASLGGNIALHLASTTSVAGVVTICTPYRLWPQRRLPDGLIAHVLRLATRLPLRVTRPVQPPSRLPDELKELAYVRTFRVPVSAYGEVGLLLLEFRGQLGQVACPALIVQSRADDLVNPGDALKLYDSIASEDKELLWLENSGHAALFDSDRELIASKVVTFVDRLAQSQSSLPRSNE